MRKGAGGATKQLSRPVGWQRRGNERDRERGLLSDAEALLCLRFERFVLLHAEVAGEQRQDLLVLEVEVLVHVHRELSQ